MIVATAICISRTWISPHGKSESKRRPIAAVAHCGESLFSALRVAVQPGRHRQQVTNGQTPFSRIRVRAGQG